MVDLTAPIEIRPVRGLPGIPEDNRLYVDQAAAGAPAYPWIVSATGEYVPISAPELDPRNPVIPSRQTLSRNLGMLAIDYGMGGDLVALSTRPFIPTGTDNDIQISDSSPDLYVVGAPDAADYPSNKVHLYFPTTVKTIDLTVIDFFRPYTFINIGAVDMLIDIAEGCAIQGVTTAGQLAVVKLQTAVTIMRSGVTRYSIVSEYVGTTAFTERTINSGTTYAVAAGDTVAARVTHFNNVNALAVDMTAILLGFEYEFTNQNARTATLTFIGTATVLGPTSSTTNVVTVGPGTYRFRKRSNNTVLMYAVGRASTFFTDISGVATAAQIPALDASKIATGLAAVATSGAYNDLSGKPALGTMAAQAASAVAVTGGTIVGTAVSNTPLTDRLIVSGTTYTVAAADKYKDGFSHYNTVTGMTVDMSALVVGYEYEWVNAPGVKSVMTFGGSVVVNDATNTYANIIGFGAGTYRCRLLSPTLAIVNSLDAIPIFSEISMASSSYAILPTSLLKDRITHFNNFASSLAVDMSNLLIGYEYEWTNYSSRSSVMNFPASSVITGKDSGTTGPVTCGVGTFRFRRRSSTIFHITTKTGTAT